MIRMPEFSWPHRGYRHTIDSALQTLRDIGVDQPRITITMTGRGWDPGTIVSQEPPAGTDLAPDVPIRLTVAGTGTFHDLPVGMWDKGTESEPGTLQIIRLLDDPMQKAGNWIRGGARLFDIRPTNLAACSRWIELFGLQPDEWPTASWYPLAVLLPSLQMTAGTREAVELALYLIMDLPLQEIRRVPADAPLPKIETSSLAGRYTRLGIDLFLSDRKESLARWIICIGPVSLARYYQLQQPDEQRRLRALLELVLPLYQEWDVSWKVLDPCAPIQLGSAEDNAILGVNSYFGTTRKETTRVEGSS